AMPMNRVAALLADRGCRWLPAGGELELDLTAEDQAIRQAEASARLALDPAAIPRRQLDASGPAA
ncbi:MAG: hypothetical protein H0V24_07720, partial [Chloroflexia bacterium]|nr:hypothetical protein [Chloroflexia bacterium]